jgi:hypothetical protein
MGRRGRQTEGDEHHVAAVPRLAKPPGNPAAVHDPRADVDDADVWTHRLQQFQPAFNVGRVINQVPGTFEGHSQLLARICAVFDQQHAPGRCAAFLREWDRNRVARSGHLLQSDRKRAAASLSIAGRGDGATLQFDEAANQGEANPRPDFACSIVRSICMYLSKTNGSSAGEMP